MSHTIPHFLWSGIIASLIYNIAITLAFLTASYIGIRFASGVVGKVAQRRFESPAIVDLMQNLSKILLWFFAILMVLSILGFDQIASSMGTASGFVALGVAYALKDVLADTVAGIYLVTDKDFEVGDKVEVESSKGTVKEIDFRKSRLELENGDKRVIRNSDVEKKWTKIE